MPHPFAPLSYAKGRGPRRAIYARWGGAWEATNPPCPTFELPQNFGFPILSDAGAALAERFGIAYTVPEEHRRYYEGILVNIPFVNSGGTYKTATEASWRLPLPAVFVVRQDGMIAFSEAHADFRVRPEPSEAMEALAALIHSPHPLR